jgi:dimethylargininase
LFTRAIVRITGSNFADGLTTVDLGVPHLDEVLHQHARYCDALRECGLELTVLDADLRHPDSTFVEDAAILTPHAAIFTRPGASSREGEVAAIQPIVERFYASPQAQSMAATSAKRKTTSSSAFRTALTKKVLANSPRT